MGLGLWRFLVLPAWFFFLCSLADAHTINFRIDKVSRIKSDITDEAEFKEIKLFVELDWGACDTGVVRVVSRIPNDLKNVIRFAKGKKVKPVEGNVGSCFKVIPQGDPWPVVDVFITAVEVDSPEFDEDTGKRDADDTEAGDYGEHENRIINIPCPASLKVTRRSAVMRLTDVSNGTSHGKVKVNYSLSCVD